MMYSIFSKYRLRKVFIAFLEITNIRIHIADFNRILILFIKQSLGQQIISYDLQSSVRSVTQCTKWTKYIFWKGWTPIGGLLKRVYMMVRETNFALFIWIWILQERVGTYRQDILNYILYRKWCTWMVESFMGETSMRKSKLRVY